jgi:hypothetical protein
VLVPAGTPISSHSGAPVNTPAPKSSVTVNRPLVTPTLSTLRVPAEVPLAAASGNREAQVCRARGGGAAVIEASLVGEGGALREGGRGEGAAEDGEAEEQAVWCHGVWMNGIAFIRVLSSNAARRFTKRKNLSRAGRRREGAPMPWLTRDPVPGPRGPAGRISLSACRRQPPGTRPGIAQEPVESRAGGDGTVGGHLALAFVEGKSEAGSRPESVFRKLVRRSAAEPGHAPDAEFRQAALERVWTGCPVPDGQQAEAGLLRPEGLLGGVLHPLV